MWWMLLGAALAADVDGDGVDEVMDCDDRNTSIYPGAPELCDGVINDCDLPALPPEEIDADGDGFVDCTLDPGGWDGTPTPIGGDDCDDTDATVYPGAPELCDGLLNDCFGDALPPVEIDDDGDGFVDCPLDPGGWDGTPTPLGGDDCDDTDASVNPLAEEVCGDEIDNDCDSVVDEDCLTTTPVDTAPPVDTGAPLDTGAPVDTAAPSETTPGGTTPGTTTDDDIGDTGSPAGALDDKDDSSGCRMGGSGGTSSLLLLLGLGWRRRR